MRTYSKKIKNNDKTAMTAAINKSCVGWLYLVGATGTIKVGVTFLVR